MSSALGSTAVLQDAPPTLADIAVVLPTIRPDESTKFLNTLLGAGSSPEVVIVFQGSDSHCRELRTEARHLAQSAGFKNLLVIHDLGRGLSRARNIGLDAVSTDRTWMWTPNDTVRVEREFLSSLMRACSDVTDSVAAVTDHYSVLDHPVQGWGPTARLNGWRLFAEPAEPAILWRCSAVKEAGGFDESLGTGGPSWAQAMEGADLLSRLDHAGWQIVTGDFTVTGSRMHRPADLIIACRKSFYYGVGYGVVARRHGHLGLGALHAISPFVELLPPQRRTRTIARRNMTDALSIVTGRAVGLALGETACRFRIPRRHRPSLVHDWVGECGS